MNPVQEKVFVVNVLVITGIWDNSPPVISLMISKKRMIEVWRILLKYTKNGVSSGKERLKTYDLMQ